MSAAFPWQDQTAQQLVRYEALFKLFDGIQSMDDFDQLVALVATQWKYFANVSSWRLVVAHDGGYRVIDSFRGEAKWIDTKALSPWDDMIWTLQRPLQVRPNEPLPAPLPPDHLTGKAVSEIMVLPVMRRGGCVGLLSAAARGEPFSELDYKFNRIFAGQFADRVLDIIQRRAATQSLIERATHDALTGLLNRGAIVERLDKALALARRTAQPLGVAIADVDFFKGVNDRFGHLAGDGVLQEVSRRLLGQARDGDSLGRYGGEEFLLVLFPCNRDELARAGERFRGGIARAMFTIAGEVPCDIAITISLGAACTEGCPDTTAQQLLLRADEALYKAKASGRNCVTVAG